MHYVIANVNASCCRYRLKLEAVVFTSPVSRLQAFMPKRERTGGGCRQQMAEPDDVALTPTCGSRLYFLLVNWILWGHISPNMAQKVAHAANKDGLMHPEVERIAKLGSWGTYPGNVWRDFQRACPNISNATSCLRLFSIPMKAHPFPCIPVECNMLEPHRIFAWMYQNAPNSFRDRLCGGSFQRLETFWTEMEDFPMYQQHPIRTREGHRQYGIPIKIHGDGVPISGLGKSWLKLAEVCSWQSCLVVGESWTNMFMMFFFYLGMMATNAEGFDTRDRFHVRLRWSLYWAWRGEWPRRDLDGNIVNASHVDWVPGAQLAGVFFLVLWRLVGDLQYMEQALGFPANQSARPCGLCQCNTTDLSWLDFTNDPAWRFSMWLVLGMPAWLAANPLRIVLLQLPGASALLWHPDWMHCKNLGSDKEFYGSILAYMCFHMVAGDPATLLMGIWISIHRWYIDHGAVSKFSSMRLGMFFKGHDKFAELRGRAAELRGFG
jgi:hypothetical protein